MVTSPAVPAYPAIGRQEFMEYLESFFSPRQMIKVRAAYEFSKAGHKGQQRDDGTRYFEHLKAVTWIVIHELGFVHLATTITALLHDIVEDQHILTPESIEMFFGLEAAVNVNLLTKHDGDSTAEYLSRMKRSGRWRVMVVKLADRLQNLRSLNACKPSKRARTIQETIELYGPLAEHLTDIAPRKYRPLALSIQRLLEDELEQLR